MVNRSRKKRIFPAALTALILCLSLLCVQAPYLPVSAANTDVGTDINSDTVSQSYTWHKVKNDSDMTVLEKLLEIDGSVPVMLVYKTENGKTGYLKGIGGNSGSYIDNKLEFYLYSTCYCLRSGHDDSDTIGANLKYVPCGSLDDLSAQDTFVTSAWPQALFLEKGVGGYRLSDYTVDAGGTASSAGSYLTSAYGVGDRDHKNNSNLSLAIYPFTMFGTNNTRTYLQNNSIFDRYGLDVRKALGCVSYDDTFTFMRTPLDGGGQGETFRICGTQQVYMTNRHVGHKSNNAEDDGAVHVHYFLTAYDTKAASSELFNNGLAQVSLGQAGYKFASYRDENETKGLQDESRITGSTEMNQVCGSYGSTNRSVSRQLSGFVGNDASIDFYLYYGVRGVDTRLIDVNGQITNVGSTAPKSISNDNGFEVKTSSGNNQTNNVLTIKPDQVYLVPQGQTLTVNKGAVLVVRSGAVLYVAGKIENKGMVVIQKGGTIAGIEGGTEGVIENTGCITLRTGSKLYIGELDLYSGEMYLYQDSVAIAGAADTQTEASIILDKGCCYFGFSSRSDLRYSEAKILKDTRTGWRGTSSSKKTTWKCKIYRTGDDMFVYTPGTR